MKGSPIRVKAAGGAVAGPAGGLAATTFARQGLPSWVPLCFLLTGVSAAALFGLTLPWLLPEALITPLAPHVLALVHLVTLGWLTMIVLGALQQLAPVILVTPLAGARLVRAAYPVYAVGVLLLITGFALSHPVLLAIGGSLIVLAVLSVVAALAATMIRSTARPLTLRFLVASLTYLVLVVSLGLTLALNLQFGFLGGALTHLLLMHVLLGIVGWLTMTLMGVSYTLARMFALAHRHDDRWGRIVFILLNLGILGLAAGFVFGWPRIVLAVPAVSLVAAVWLYAADFARLLRLRLRRPLEPTQYHALVGAGYLALVIPLAVVMILLGGSATHLMVALGLAALVGWVGQNTLGYLYKIVPFLVWQDRFGARVGREKVPLMRDLLAMRWAWASFWLVNGGLLLTLVSLLLGWDGLARVCGVPLGLGLLLAAINVIGVPVRARQGDTASRNAAPREEQATAGA